jgi:hypothetical protein
MHTTPVKSLQSCLYSSLKIPHLPIIVDTQQESCTKDKTLGTNKF